VTGVAGRSMRLADLLAGAGVDANPAMTARELRVTGICDDSRTVRAGDLYVALRGSQQDGRTFIAQAIERGAIAVLAESDDSVAVDITVAAVPVIAVRHLRGHVGRIAAVFFGDPSRAMRVLAVTGTNGKTTTSWLLAAALEQLGERAAVLGTLGVGAIGARKPLHNTTPGAVALQSLFAGLHDAGFTAVAMEASSIGIEQQRMAGTHLRVAMFTNLSHDHLDYHGDMSAYAAAKAELFSWPELAGAVLNGDDPVALQWLAEGRVRAGRVLTYGSAGRGHDIELVNIAVAQQGMVLQLNIEGRAVSMPVRLVGRFNAGNLMAVVGALRVLGHGVDDIVRVLANVDAPAGRMETFGGGAEPLCVVDYAHTPDALEKVLTVLRERTRGALWCVFGCGGNRDAGKRPLMGRIAAALAEHVVVTSDNPRDEKPDAIIADIVAGAGVCNALTTEVDRAAAIRMAVTAAAAGDTVLVAGKGHEDYQEIAGTRHAFSDAQHVQAALAARMAAAGGAPC
jgi:UDP-N-acetylmuramoyl-L-alanyl-D-glutamate--2,6-diaminopimelate ligase